jgi:hypothetical protein
MHYRGGNSSRLLKTLSESLDRAQSLSLSKGRMEGLVEAFMGFFGRIRTYVRRIAVQWFNESEQFESFQLFNSFKRR